MSLGGEWGAMQDLTSVARELERLRAELERVQAERDQIVRELDIYRERHQSERGQYETIMRLRGELNTAVRETIPTLRARLGEARWIMLNEPYDEATPEESKEWLQRRAAFLAQEDTPA